MFEVVFFTKISMTIKCKIKSKKKLNTYISRLNIGVSNKIENLNDMPILLLLFLIVYFVLLFYKKIF